MYTLHYCIVPAPCEAQDWHVANGNDRGSVLKERALHLSDGQMQRRRAELLGVGWGGEGGECVALTGMVTEYGIF